MNFMCFFCCLILCLAFEFCFLVGAVEFVAHKLDISVKEVFKIIYGEIDSVVCHAALWVVIGPDSFASVASANLTFAVACVF